MINSIKKMTTTWSLLMNFCWFHPEISQQCQHGIIPPLLRATVLELPENHSVPERTTDLRSHGQLESIDFLNLNHFTRQGFRSPRRITDGELRSHWYLYQHLAPNSASLTFCKNMDICIRSIESRIWVEYFWVESFGMNCGLICTKVWDA